MKLYKKPNSNNWYLRYSHRGRLIRESTGTEDEAEARKAMKFRQGQIGADYIGKAKFVLPASESLKVSELLKSLRKDLELRGLKSINATLNHLEHTENAFGYLRVKHLSAELIDDWIEKAQGELSVATINRRLGILKQALHLAKRRGLLSELPQIRRLSELGRERKGFFEKSEFEAIYASLPAPINDFAKFGYLTGWRFGEIASLRWQDVDLQAKVIRLRPENSKNAQGRMLALEGELWELIQRQQERRSYQSHRKADSGSYQVSSFVFHRGGHKVVTIQKVWLEACESAKLPGKHFHDLRRTAVRNMVRAGVPERMAMATSGHKTRAIFDRYNIVNEDDLRATQRKLQEHLESQPTEQKVVQFKG